MQAYSLHPHGDQLLISLHRVSLLQLAYFWRKQAALILMTHLSDLSDISVETPTHQQLA